MLRMVSYPHRPQSGHIMCYLNRTYHVLPTILALPVDNYRARRQYGCAFGTIGRLDAEGCAIR
jgi:hypothetical protein